MVKEVILVEIINKSNMSTDKSKAFTNTEKAEAYFKELLEEAIGELDEEDVECALDDGYWDFCEGLEEKSISIKEISFEED